MTMMIDQKRRVENGKSSHPTLAEMMIVGSITTVLWLVVFYLMFMQLTEGL